MDRAILHRSRGTAEEHPPNVLDVAALRTHAGPDVNGPPPSELAGSEKGLSSFGRPSCLARLLLWRRINRIRRSESETLCCVPEANRNLDGRV